MNKEMMAEEKDGVQECASQRAEPEKLELRDKRDGPGSPRPQRLGWHVGLT